jgi:circadian clock protein KaiC
MIVTTGLAGLDKILNGGFPKRTAVLLSGGPGAGKTLFGLNFLADGAEKGEKCYYLSFLESKEELVRACEGIESLSKAKKYLGKNLIIDSAPLGENMSLEQLEKLISSYPNINRVVIDNANKMLIHAKDSKEYRLRLSQIIRYLKEKVDCALLICETEGEAIDTGNGEAFEADGVIKASFLDLEEKPTRTLQVYKMRYTDFEPKVRHELSISKKAIKLTTTRII